MRLNARTPLTENWEISGVPTLASRHLSDVVKTVLVLYEAVGKFLSFVDIECSAFETIAVRLS